MLNFSTFPFSVRGRNLALEGKAYQSSAFKRGTASKAIDMSDDSCISSRKRRKNIWWRVDFVNLVELHALDIKPGKLEMLQEY